jgi:TRAP transporter TAXI family solute receptor
MIKYFIYFFIIIFFSFCEKLPKLTLGTGDELGNYYRGGLILREFASKSGLEIDVINTDGSYENVMSVGHGKLNLGLSQKDVLVYFNYLSEDHKKASQNSLVIAPIELEYLHIIVNNNSKIKSMDDLQKKKIATGSVKSGTSFTFGFLNYYLYKTGIDKPNFLVMDEKEAINKVAKGELDAAFLVSTLGTKLLTDLPEDSNIRLLSYSKGEIPERIKEVYLLGTIPAKTYSWQKEEITVPVVHSFLIASPFAPEKSIRKLVKIIYENEDKLDANSEIWSENATEVYYQLRDSGIPYHPIVQEYFRKKK